MLKIGIVGIGNWGYKIFSRLKILDNRFEIKFVCDLKIKNLKKIDQKFNRVKNYKNSSKFG